LGAHWISGGFGFIECLKVVGINRLLPFGGLCCSYAALGGLFLLVSYVAGLGRLGLGQPRPVT